MKHKLLDFILILLTLAVGVFFFKFVRGNLELGERVAFQASQASVLIDEIGEAKEENQTLYEKLQKAEEKISNFQKLFSFDRSGTVAQERLEPEKIPRVPELPQIPNTENFLLVGHHKRLADSIILAAISEARAKITLVSIPRDLVVNGRKINEYLSLFSPEKLQEKVSEVVGLPLSGYAIIDFRAFETIIDALGGIDIHAPTAIYDPLFPDGFGNYTLYAIDAGSHHINGAEALKYARSRHSTSDFDRAKRQQQILRAVQERVLNFGFLKRMEEVKRIFEALARPSLSEAKQLMSPKGESFLETNLGFFKIAEAISKYQNFTIESGHVISTENFLSAGTNIAGQYILTPRSGNFGKIQRYIRDILF